MRSVLIAAAALVALAGPAQAAPKHTWFYVDFAEAKCVLSLWTPQEVASKTGAPRISPEDVLKDPSGDLTVMVKLDQKTAIFFSSREKCEAAIKDTNLKPDQAPADQIN
jgi:hypothetical protein